jgi:hypothetical protein
MQQTPPANRVKVAASVVIALPVALLHFVTGPDYSGPFPVFVNGYLIDLVLPLAAYFLLAPQTLPILRHPAINAGAVFGFGLLVEFSQLVGINLFGSTFDPLDIAMYAAGVGAGVLLDQVILPRLWPAWAADSLPAVRKRSMG